MPTKSVEITLKFKDDGSIIIDQANKKLGDLHKTVGDSKAGLDAFHSEWVAIAAKIGIAAGAFYAAKRVIFDTAKEIASATDAIKSQAEIAGLDIETMQKLQYAAKMTGVTQDDLALSLKFLSRNMAEAAQGTGEAKSYFEAIGVTMEDLKSKSPYNVLLKIADAFSKTEDPINKQKYAQEMLGRVTEKMILFLNQGSAGIRAYGDEAVRLGTILGTVVVEKGSQADLQFKRLGATLNALKISLAPLATEFMSFVEKITSGYALIGEATGLTNLSGLEDQQKQVQKLLDLKRWLKYAEEEAAKPQQWYEWDTMYKKRVEEWTSSAEAYRKRIKELQDSWKAQGSVAEQKKAGLPTIMTDEMRRQQADLAKARLAATLEEIKSEEALEKERAQTRLATLEQTWKQNLISEEEYLGRKKDLEQSVFQFSIALSAKGTDAIIDGYKQIIKWLPVEAEKIKAREEKEKELGRIRSENLLKAEQLAQIGIKGDTDLLELTKQITIVESEGRLKVLEEQINKQKELNELRVGLGMMRPGTAALEELDANKRLTEEKVRHLELQRSLEPSAEKQKGLTTDILSLNIQLEDAEKRRLKLLPEFGTFLEGWNVGLKQYLVSLETTFEQGVELAKKSSQLMEQAFSDFLYTGQFKFKSFLDNIRRMLADFQAKQIMQALFGKETGAGAGTGGLFGDLTTWVKGLSSGVRTTTGTENLYNWQLAEQTGGGGYGGNFLSLSGLGGIGGGGGGTTGAGGGGLLASLGLGAISKTIGTAGIVAALYMAIIKPISEYIGKYIAGAHAGTYTQIGSYLGILGAVMGGIIDKLIGGQTKAELGRETTVYMRSKFLESLTKMGFEIPKAAKTQIIGDIKWPWDWTKVKEEGGLFGFKDLTKASRKAITDIANQIYQDVTTAFSSSVAAGLKAGTEKSGFRVFTTNLKQSISDSIIDGMTTAFVQAAALQKLLMPLYQYITQSVSTALEKGFNIDEFIKTIKEKYAPIVTAMGTMEPLFAALYGATADIRKTITGSGGGGLITLPSGQAGIPYVPYTGIYKLHKGEEVVPIDQRSNSRNVQSMTINQYMGGVTVGNGMDVQMVGRRMARMIWWATKRPIVFG
jgi:hypothetical protein